MLGDRAPLPRSRRSSAATPAPISWSMKRTRSAVLGDHGRGMAEEAGVEADVDFVIGTFSKSLGAIGATAPATTRSSISSATPTGPYVFTASSSPSIIASTRKALGS